MSTSPQPGAASGAPVTSDTDFGPNEWLVDEMYDRFVKDPSSVDEAWRQLFKDRQAAGSNGQQSQPSAKAATSPPAKSAEKAPAKAPDKAPAKAPDKAPAPAKPQEAGHSKPGPAPEPAATAPSPSPAATTGSAAASSAAPKGTASDTAAPAAQPATAAAVAKPVPKEPTKDDTADALQKPEHVILRGAAARTVSNMDSSLAVPTATSVRSVPVKLLIDNRIVINNHLARARGGKVSFTHIIGFALVRALRQMPEMNYGFEVVDGKPNLIKPRHINLGLAIDVQKQDGTRQLLVPSIKGADDKSFAQFWSAYEDVVRRTRDNKLIDRGLPGHHDHAHQPGHDRHQPLGAAADERPGLHPRRRGDGATRRSTRARPRRRSTATRSARS